MAYQPKSYRKFVATAATATLVATAVAPAALAASSFTDVAPKYKEAVDYLFDNGITSGKTEELFGTHDNIKRGELAIWLVRALGLEEAAKEAAPSGFADVAGTYYDGYVSVLKEAKILDGLSADEFGVNAFVTRGQMAKLLSNAYGLTSEEEAPFTDMGQWAPFINGLYAYEITSGKTEELFGTGDNITRGDLAIFMFKAETLPPAEDVVAPVLSFDGETSIELENGAEFVLPEVQVDDEEAEVYYVITDAEGNEVEELDTTVAGTYTLTFTAEDAAGNVSEDLVFTVVVKEAAVVAPAVESVSAINLKTVVVEFNTDVNVDSAESLANYSFAAGSGLAVTDAVAEGNVVTLTVNDNDEHAAQQQSADLTINGVKAANGVVIAKTTKSVKFLDTVAPTVENIEVAGPKTIKVKFSELLETVPSFSVDNGTLAIVSTSFVAGTDTVTLTLGAAPSEGTHTVTVKNGSDYAGFKVEEVTKEFAYAKDVTAPIATVKSASPNKVVLEFNEDLANVSSANVNFYHTYKGVDAYKATKSLDGKELTLEFANPLPEGPFKVYLDYTDDKGTKLTDLWGNEVAETTFSGSVTVDTVAPTVTKVEADGNTGIEVTYSEDVTGADVLSNYSLKDAAGNVVTLSGTITKNGNTYTVPTPALNGGSYTLTIKNIKDTAIGQNKMADYTTTVAVDDVVPPTVKDLDDQAAGTQAQLLSAKKVKIVFAEVMDSASITDKANYLFDGVALDSKVTLTAADSNKSVILDFTDVESGDQTTPESEVINVLRVKDAAGNPIAAASTNVLVPATPTAPLFDEAVATGKNTIKLYFDELVTNVKADDFTVDLDGTPSAVTSVSNEVVDGKSVVTLTTAGNIDTAVTDVTVSTTGTVDAKNAYGVAVSLTTEEVLDGYAPLAVSAAAVESDGDNFVNRFVVTFSEDLYVASVQDSDFTVEGYEITGVTTSGSAVTLTVKEKDTNDLAATPKVTLVGAVEDLDRNVRSSQDAIVATSAQSGIDAAALASARQSLTNAITAANTAQDGVEISADGTDVPVGTAWVTQAENDALDSAIATATTALNTATTVTAVNNAKSALDSAVTTYEAAKEDGTLSNYYTNLSEFTTAADASSTPGEVFTLDLSNIAGGDIVTSGDVIIRLIGDINGDTFNVNTPNADVIDNTTGGTINVIDAANSSYYYNGTSSIIFNDNNGRFVNEKVTPANLTVGSNVTVTLGGTIGTVVVGSNSTITVEADATVKEVQGDETVTIGGDGAENVEGVIATVSTQEELTTALGKSSITTIVFGAEFSVSAPVVIDRAVIIEGNDKALDFGFEVRTGNVVIQNLTINGQGYTDNASADVAIYVSDTTGELVTVNNVTINYAPENGLMYVGGITAVATSNILVKDSEITVEDTAVTAENDGSASIYTYGAIEVIGLTSNSPAGIVIDHSVGGLVGEITGNTFNGTWVGVTLFNSASQFEKTKEDTKVTLLDPISDNTFNPALVSELGDDWRVSLGN
jgi:hypothetical protein